MYLNIPSLTSYVKSGPKNIKYDACLYKKKKTRLLQMNQKLPPESPRQMDSRVVNSPAQKALVQFE